MKNWNTWKTLLVLWIILGTVALIVGVSKLTFAAVWVLYMYELWGNAFGSSREADALVREIEMMAADAQADVAIDENITDAAFDDGRHQGMVEALRIVKEYCYGSADES